LQVCLNVNHVLVDPLVRKELIARMTIHFDTFLGGRDAQPEWITHIVNDRNFARLDNLLKETQGRIVYGGQRDPSTRYFAPTVVVDVKPGDSLLSEEIFGPILPIIDMTYDQAIEFTAKGEHPLALYPFTESQVEKDRITKETLSGGVTFNDCAMHAFAKGAPFGGVGSAGTGAYHGPYGVLAFSHLRTYVNGLPSWLEGLMSARYPPYSDKKTKMLAPAPKPGFDRDGNDKGVFGGVAAILGLGAAAATAYVLVPKDVYGKYLAKFVN
jgi:aldehyde dehydrogenase (NAD+)